MEIKPTGFFRTMKNQPIIGWASLPPDQLIIIKPGQTVELREGKKTTKFKAYYRNIKLGKIYLREIKNENS